MPCLFAARDRERCTQAEREERLGEFRIQREGGEQVRIRHFILLARGISRAVSLQRAMVACTQRMSFDTPRKVPIPVTTFSISRFNW